MPGPRRARLDRELVRRGLAESRDHAVQLIGSGAVRVRGAVAVKATTAVTVDDPLLVVAQEQRWASRGAHKLLGALEAWHEASPPLLVAGRRCLDAGASTGGFTDVLLRHGAAAVHAVDVGYGQLAWGVRSDPRVRVHDRTNVRDLQPEVLGGPVDLTVADLSFIGLEVVLPALARCTAWGGDLVVLVKPQFEVGREQLPRGGVVREPEHRRQAILRVVAAAQESELVPWDVVASPLPGPAGNVEYLLRLRATTDAPPVGDWAALAADAVARGPA